MALTRKFLKALGIEEDKIEEIISAHGETVTALKEERDKALADAATLEEVTKERDKLQGEAETLRKAGGDAAKVQADFDAYKAQIDKERENAGKEKLVRRALTEAGANGSVLDLLLRGIDLDAVEVEGGALKDAAAVVDPVKAQYSGVFGVVTPSGVPPVNPPGGGGAAEPKTLAEALHQRYDTK